jgi:hypothetical protein
VEVTATERTEELFVHFLDILPPLLFFLLFFLCGLEDTNDFFVFAQLSIFSVGYFLVEILFC